MRVNREIRVPRVRVINAEGEQVGVLTNYEAMKMAEEAGLDLVEVVATASPPVCKIMNYGKFQYDQSKREKESKKSQHQVKLKEVKLKPNIGDHDLEVKIRHAREFISEGNKVKVTCTFRGREMAHTEIGVKIVGRFCDSLTDVASVETPSKMLGRIMTLILAPGAKKKGDKPRA